MRLFPGFLCENDFEYCVEKQVANDSGIMIKQKLYYLSMNLFRTMISSKNPVNAIILGQKEVSLQQDGIAKAIPSCCFHFPYKIKPEINFQIKHPFHPFQVSAIPVTDFPLSRIHFTVCFPISPNISVNACHYFCDSRI